MKRAHLFAPFALAAASGCGEYAETAPPPVYVYVRAAPPAHSDGPPPTAFVPDARAWPRRSISLGHIGDEPLGRFGSPERYEPAWTRPFPCSWTHSCWVPPYDTSFWGYAPRLRQPW